jgi:hypothetical protein
LTSWIYFVSMSTVHYVPLSVCLFALQAIILSSEL